VLGLFVLSSCLCSPPCGDSAWVTLFDGSDIKQWERIEGGDWTIEDGVLVGRNGQNWTTDPEKTGSYLRTRKMYIDFELTLEYTISERGNSGIHFRSAAEKNPSFTGYELQITNCYGREVNEKNAGLYDLVAPIKNMAKPAGEFNHAVLRVQGHHIQVWLNGEQIIDYMGNRRLEGYIGLQNHDERSVVQFKNIRIREL